MCSLGFRIDTWVTPKQLRYRQIHHDALMEAVLWSPSFN